MIRFSSLNFHFSTLVLVFFIVFHVVVGCSSQDSEPDTNIRSLRVISKLSSEKNKCRVQAQVTISAAKPSLTVNYTEPTTRGSGQPLKNLSHTTIYLDTGSSLNKMKEVPATSPTGGGNISEVLSFPITQEQPISVSICVTATDSEGNES